MELAHLGRLAVSNTAAASTTDRPGLSKIVTLELPAFADLPARRVRVVVPPQKPTHHLYVHDGQRALEGGLDLARLAGPSTLVIAIDHGANRFAEYTPNSDRVGDQLVGGKAALYADHLERTLRPRIEATYGKPQRVGVLGTSLGGLFAFYQAHRHPGRFHFAASLSGTLAWGAMTEKGPTLIDRFAADPPRKTTLYLDSGGGPGAGDNYQPTRDMADTLARRGFVWQQNLFHWHAPGARHNEDAWRARLPRVLDIFEKLTSNV